MATMRAGQLRRREAGRPDLRTLSRASGPHGLPATAQATATAAQRETPRRTPARSPRPSPPSSALPLRGGIYAEDALADACVQFLRFFDGVTDEHALRWMLVVVKRCAWAISRRRRERASLLEAVPREEIQGEPCRGPVELLEVAEEVREFGAALDELKPDERRALALLALGYSYREIAESQGWTRTKVNRCLAEGRARLRRLLAEGGESQ